MDSVLHIIYIPFRSADWLPCGVSTAGGARVRLRASYRKPDSKRSAQYASRNINIADGTLREPE